MTSEYCEPITYSAMEWHEPEPSWHQDEHIEALKRMKITDALAAALLAVSARVRQTSLRERFYSQADIWQQETEHLSSPSQMMMHPSYQAVMGMVKGNEDEIVRLMIKDLRDNRRMWFWALSYITKDNPIKPAEAGHMDKMIRSWTDWGKSRGMI
jgi:hypothetical protein